MSGDFRRGLFQGIPIALGYLSVSFGFGIMVIQAGMSVLTAVGISATNLTSAGQVAGVTVMAAGGTLAEMALTQLIINMRYALMGLSLSQHLDPSFTSIHRLICSFGITDEVFAVASVQKKKVTPPFMYGLILLPFLGWTGGTLLGAIAGQLMPESVSNAMGIMIYGMFIAIVMPMAKQSKGVLTAVLVATAISCVFKYCLPFIPSGFVIIISAVAAAMICSAVFPAKPIEDGDAK